MKNTALSFLAALFACVTPTFAPAQTSVEEIVSVEMLEGWRDRDGTHTAGIRIRLAEGWKTYWRAPGDGGLPTSLNWARSDNLATLDIVWPRPQVFDDAGMRSIGYMREVVLPLELTPKTNASIRLDARLNLGVCKEVCVPIAVDLKQTLTADDADGIAAIKAALTTRPEKMTALPAASVNCALTEANEGHMARVELRLDLPGDRQAMVIETPFRKVWVGKTDLSIDGNTWRGSAKILDHRSKGKALSEDDLRITFLTDEASVEIKGCRLD